MMRLMIARLRGYKTSATNIYSHHQIVYIGLIMRRIIDDDDGETKEIDSLSVPEK